MIEFIIINILIIVIIYLLLKKDKDFIDEKLNSKDKLNYNLEDKLDKLESKIEDKLNIKIDNLEYKKECTLGSQSCVNPYVNPYIHYLNHYSSPYIPYPNYTYIVDHHPHGYKLAHKHIH